jgi:hypothetical protein
MNSNGFGRKRSWHNLKVLSGHSSGGTEEQREKPVRISGLQTVI